MNTWLQIIVVRGPVKEVMAFFRNAATRDKAEYVNELAHLRTQRLSFVKLYNSLPAKLAGKVDTERNGMQDPFDLSVEPIRKFRNGTAVVTYRFQLSSMEPENFITVLSEFYPRLCFAVGMVDPASNQASSQLSYRGKSWRWRLPSRRVDAIYPILPDDVSEDDAYWTMVKCDAKAMDEVINHWELKAKAIAEEIVRSGARRERKRHPLRH